MSQFEKKEISRSFYLKQMGALCLKASKESDRLVNEPNVVGTQAADTDSDDSLSKTRMMPHSSNDDSSDQESLVSNRRLHVAPVRPKRRNAGAPRPVCPVCKKGFQLNRLPPLHLNCSKCKAPTHKRCISKPNEAPFLCVDCNKRVISRKSVSPRVASPQSDSTNGMHLSTLHATNSSSINTGE